jgi:N-acetylated-alpha-linked acidic dipeptidase
VIAASVVTLSVATAAQSPRDAPPLFGFSAASSTAQRQRETALDTAVDAGNLREWTRRMSARPHHVGSAYGRENAEFIAGLFRSWGYDVTLEQYDVLLPTPVVRSLEMVAPSRFVAGLAEPPVKEDSTSGLPDQLPVYNAYSIDGDVTGELVYVNQGVPADYEELARRGIDVKGKIVIARYGGSWRGIKPKVAAERGAIGCLIYSDPREDGYFQGDIYPTGGYRSERAAQRGSVADMPVHPGDPLTPGVAATADAQRPANVREAATLTKIPVLPISYGDAAPLLAAMRGPMAPPAWRGALPQPYRLGPGPAKVHLRLQFDWKLVPAINVIATLRGRDLPDQWIIRGNHHDAWVFGAADPASGMAAVLEEARAVGQLAKSGWRPRRTIVYAAWDGEEQGLLGSTEWVEHRAPALREKAVAYINSDSNGPGFFFAGGSPALERFVNEAARDVDDPRKGISVAERALAAVIVGGSAEDRAAARERRAFELEPLGSGSDFTPFLQHLGIASLNVGFGGEGEYGQYHSSYDSFDHYARFMDTDFAYGAVFVKVAGRLTLRLADADVLPFEFARTAAAISRYVDEVGKLTDSMRADTVERNRRLDERAYEAVANPAGTWVAPPRLDEVPHLNLSPLQNAAHRVERSAREFDKALAQAMSGSPAPATLLAADAVLMKSEQALTSPDGLPGRPWFKHQVYAPGLYTGYGVKTLPGVREAIEQRRWQEAEQQALVVARTLEQFARHLDAGTALLRK